MDCSLNIMLHMKIMQCEFQRVCRLEKAKEAGATQVLNTKDNDPVAFI